ncbi:capsular biosynthesis protein [uncultured Helicobacter sp.]|uniref:capsular biosynthesis protein n=1 Tax=uncultured Helicobacter sp. TaxID=175537 RepID=UPI00258E7B91|nr:capsular biosynthesis protein [uncultured Helicobacter sp.]
MQNLNPNQNLAQNPKQQQNLKQQSAQNPKSTKTQNQIQNLDSKNLARNLKLTQKPTQNLTQNLTPNLNKPNVAIMADFDIAKRPRPFALTQILKTKCNLFLIARECSHIKGTQSFSFPPPRTNASTRTQQEKQILRHNCIHRNFAPLIYTPNRLHITEILRSLPKMDLLIVEDITLLPFASEYKAIHHCKIVLDLREFYPLEYEDKQWQETLGQFFYFLCQNYLKNANLCLCVSENIAKRYKQEFGIDSRIYYSLPAFFDMRPTSIHKPIEIIYHGFISIDRDSYNLIELAKILGDDFLVNLMVVSHNQELLDHFTHTAKKVPNIRILPPVAMQEIIPFCNRFDIGILSLQPNSFNNANAMPNKLFEYIQSRLCVISTPIQSIATFLQTYQVGVVSLGFTPSHLACTIRSLSPKQILFHKEQSHFYAKSLSIESNQHKIMEFLKELEIL